MSTLPSIFISYSREDAVFVDQLEADLSKHGFVTWVDRKHLEAGQDWAMVIEAQIKRYEIMLVVLSPASVDSTWVKREIAFAQQIKKEIVPILVKATQVPLLISELQFVDFTSDFANGTIQLLTALLKPRASNPLQLRKLQPSYTFPDSVVQESLIDIPEPPPESSPDLEVLYMQARSAFVREDWDTSEALLQQIVAKDPDYDSGIARTDLATTRKNLIPVQIKRLKTKAYAAHRSGQWGEEIACWKAMLGIGSYNQSVGLGVGSYGFYNQDPILGINTYGSYNQSAVLSIDFYDQDDAKKQLAIAEQNQRAERIYKRASAFVKAKDILPARSEIERLKKEAPYYGDPEHLARQIRVLLLPRYLGHREKKVRGQQALEVRPRQWSAIREGGAYGAFWGLSLGMIGSALAFGSFTNIGFEIGNGWINLLVALTECLLVGGTLAIYGMGIDNLWGNLSTFSAIINCIFLGGLSGLLIGDTNSTALIQVSQTYIGASVTSCILVGIVIIFTVFLTAFNQKSFFSHRDSDLKVFFVFIICSAMVVAIILILNKMIQPEVTLLPGLIYGAIISLCIYVFLRLLDKNQPPLWLVFGLSGAAIGVVGGSVWAHAIDWDINAGYDAFSYAIGYFLIGGLLLALIGWLLGAIIATFRYNLNRRRRVL